MNTARKLTSSSSAPRSGAARTATRGHSQVRPRTQTKQQAVVRRRPKAKTVSVWQASWTVPFVAGLVAWLVLAMIGFTVLEVSGRSTRTWDNRLDKARADVRGLQMVIQSEYLDRLDSVAEELGMIPLSRPEPPVAPTAQAQPGGVR